MSVFLIKIIIPGSQNGNNCKTMSLLCDITVYSTWDSASGCVYVVPWSSLNVNSTLSCEHLRLFFSGDVYISICHFVFTTCTRAHCRCNWVHSRFHIRTENGRIANLHLHLPGYPWSPLWLLWRTLNAKSILQSFGVRHLLSLF